MTADQHAVFDITGDLRTLGAYLRGLRESDDSDVTDIARQAAITPTRLAAIETGDADPTIRELATLAYVLGVVLRVGFRPMTLLHDRAEITRSMTEDEEDAFWGTHDLGDELWATASPSPPVVRTRVEQEETTRAKRHG